MDAHETQRELFPIGSTGPQILTGKAARSGSFVDNMRLPIHRWFRYSAGFSAQWAQQVIEGTVLGPGELVLDPFAGSGTSLIAAQSAGVSSIGIENHPFVYRIAQAKLNWTADERQLLEEALLVLERAKASGPRGPRAFPLLLTKCYPAETLTRLEALKHSCLEYDINRQRWSHFVTQPAKVESPMQRMIHHEDAETVFG